MGVQTQVEAPEYVLAAPKQNLSAVFENGPTPHTYHGVDVLQDWPTGAKSSLDSSQLAALRRILSKRLAIVQGPPGTGKTHVSVEALKTLQTNIQPSQPPIIVTAHTNHALDQILRHIAVFEPDFIRIGGMTLDQDVIAPRTLFEVRKALKLDNDRAPPALGRVRDLTKQMCELLKPLTANSEPLPATLFAGYGIITATQAESIARGAREWHCVSEDSLPSGDMAMWLSTKNLLPAKKQYKPVDFGVQIEEAELEMEEVQEMEAEQKASADDEIEALKGIRVVFNEPWAGRIVKSLSETKIQEHLKEDDLWEIPNTYRGTIYYSMRMEYVQKVTAKFRNLAARYAIAVRDVKISRWQNDVRYLSRARIIGCTTTGLSKYRALLSGLRPKVVMIEEAAETLEAYVTAACFDSLEHLILVGDHQQLRPHCNIQELEGHPYNLAVSLFERLVCNQVEFSQLLKQRRMRPEIRKALTPIYGNLTDHPCVLERELIPGMAGISNYFFSHKWHEDVDDHQSKVNIEEARMVVAFFNYLVDNGMEVKHITILTFYNGQRKFIIDLLRRHPNLQGEVFNVKTVDSYQGEENQVVVLSLARSNRSRNIGFLSIVNRVCVAMSRAQRGFYIFGNAKMLCQASKIWWQVVQVMAQKPRRVGFHLPITCQNHRKRTYVDGHEGLASLNGGCSQPCLGELPCGHLCQLKCHVMSHELVNCHVLCDKKLECGHLCREYCYLPCQCTCDAAERSFPRPAAMARPRRPQLFNGDVHESVGAYRQYATGGHIESDARLAEILETEEHLAQLRLQDEENKRVATGDATSPDNDDLIVTSKIMTPQGKMRWRHEGIFVPGSGANSPPKQEAMKENQPLSKPQPKPLNPSVPAWKSTIMEPLIPTPKMTSNNSATSNIEANPIRNWTPSDDPLNGVRNILWSKDAPEKVYTVHDDKSLRLNAPHSKTGSTASSGKGSSLNDLAELSTLSNTQSNSTNLKNGANTKPMKADIIEKVQKPIRQPYIPDEQARWSSIKENMKPSSTIAKPMFSDSAFQGLHPASKEAVAPPIPELVLHPADQYLYQATHQGHQASVTDEDDDSFNSAKGEDGVIYHFQEHRDRENKGKESIGDMYAAQIDMETGIDQTLEEAELWGMLEGTKKENEDRGIGTPNAEEVKWSEGEGDLLGLL